MVLRTILGLFQGGSARESIADVGSEVAFAPGKRPISASFFAMAADLRKSGNYGVGSTS